MSSATFDYTNTSVFSTMVFTSASTHSGVPDKGNTTWQGQFRFDFYGESLELQAISVNSGSYTVQVDGGSVNTITTTAVMQYWTLASGLSLGWHTVVVVFKLPGINNIYIANSAALRVTASDNNPQIRNTTAYTEWLRLDATQVKIEGRALVNSFIGYTWARRCDLGFMHHRFRAKTASLPVYHVYTNTGAGSGNSGGFFAAIYVDGAIQGSGFIASTNIDMNFIDIAAALSVTLDAAAYHEYEIVYATRYNADSIYAVAGYALSVQSDAAATYSSRRIDGYIGDSICTGEHINNPFVTYPYLTSRESGAVAVKVAQGSTLTSTSGVSFATTCTGFGINGYAVDEFGTNDMGSPGTTPPGSTFSTADVGTLNQLLTSAAYVYRLGILPRSGVASADRAVWNGSGTSAVRANIAGCNAPGRVTYVDPDTASLVDPTDYFETSPTERLHPSTSGHRKIANILLQQMAAQYTGASIAR